MSRLEGRPSYITEPKSWDVDLLDYVTQVVSLAASSFTIGAVTVSKTIGFGIPTYDYIALGYTGSNLTTVVYKTGGSGGSTVGTLTLAYTGSQLDSVTKT